MYFLNIDRHINTATVKHKYPLNRNKLCCEHYFLLLPSYTRIPTNVIMDKICEKNVQNHIASFVNELMIQRYNEISRIERNES